MPELFSGSSHTDWHTGVVCILSGVVVSNNVSLQYVYSPLAHYPPHNNYGYGMSNELSTSVDPDSNSDGPSDLQADSDNADNKPSWSTLVYKQTSVGHAACIHMHIAVNHVILSK